MSLGGMENFSWERRLVLLLMSVVVFILFTWVVQNFTITYTLAVTWFPVGLYAQEDLVGRLSLSTLNHRHLHLDMSLAGAHLDSWHLWQRVLLPLPVLQVQLGFGRLSCS